MGKKDDIFLIAGTYYEVMNDLDMLILKRNDYEIKILIMEKWDP